MKKLTEKEYVAPWEKAFSKVLTPLEEFIHRQTKWYSAHAVVVSASRSQNIPGICGG